MKLQGQNKINPQFSMSSMTDVVFLLLIFFMLTTNVPTALNVLLPEAKGKATHTQKISVTITKELEYFVNGEPIRKEELETALKKALEGHKTPTLMLQAEETIALKEAVAIMDIANKNQYKVILAVRPQ